MVRKKTDENNQNCELTDGRSEASRYKSVAAEERAIIRRHRTYCRKLAKEIEGMTDQEQIDYLNKLGRDAAEKMGLTRFLSK